MNPVNQTIRLRNAVTLDYAEQGPPDGAVVILLHGFPDSWRSYAPVMRHMAPELRVIAPSLRGFGESDAPLGEYHPRDLAADVAEFMRRLDIPAAHVVGHSMGSYVAAYLAIDHPACVLGLFPIGTFPCLAGRSDIAELVAALEAMEGAVDPSLIRDFQRGTLAQPVAEDFFAGILAESAKVPLHVWRAALTSLAKADLEPESGAIGAPTTLFWGDQDGFSSLAEQLAVTRSIPGADLQIYRGAGHSLHWEEPERFAAELSERIAAIASGRPIGRAAAQPAL